MKCGYQCHGVGGPWIAENPDCPVHGTEAQMIDKWRDISKDRLYQQIRDANTVQDLRSVLYDIVKML